MDGIELGKMVGGLGDAYVRGQQAGMEKAVFPMKVGLMEQQQQIGAQQLQSGQMALENQKKVQEYGRRFSEEFKANPNQDPYELKTRIAGELGLPEEVFKGLEEGEKKFKSSLETGIAIFKWSGKKGLTGWLAEHPELSKVISIEDLPEDPVRGIVVKFPDGTSIKAVRDETTGKVEVIKSTELSESDILALPETDPRRQSLISGKKEIQAPKSMTEVDILSLPETDARKQAYVKGKKEISTKDPYFQAVGIIEETNELIGYDTRSFQTKRVPIGGMPIKPGTVKSVDPVKQAIADAIKESKGKVSTESKTPQGKKTVEDTINDLKAKGNTPARIIELMSEAGIDPDPYMDLINK